MRNETEWFNAVVKSTRDVAQGIREIGLEPAGAGPAYPTGSHIQLRVLVDGKPALRHYSLVGDRPRAGLWRIAVKRGEPGRGGSRYMWSLKPGARIEVSRPGSHFQLSATHVPRLLIAGGIGITPLFGMAEALQRRGDPFRLLYAGRSRETMAYLPELAAICGDALHGAIEDETGRPDLEAEIERLPTNGEAYVCGPIGLLEMARRLWAEAGRARGLLVYESFGTSGRHPTDVFNVRIPRLGIDIDVPPDVSLLEALEGAGVGVLSDCRRGECGLCQMDVLALRGDIDHRDVFFSDEEHRENHRLCACVSRVTGGGSVELDIAWRGDRQLKSGVELIRQN